MTSPEPEPTPAEPAPAPAPAPSADDVHAQLAQSEASTIYLDLELAEEEAAAFLAEGLMLERDVVRGLWAVRAATDEEVAEATEPTAEAPSTSA